jgi:hypothetical protein
MVRGQEQLMPITTGDPKSSVITMRLTAAMRKQLDFLADAGFGNQTDILRLAVDRMYQQESPLKARAPYRQYLIESVATKVSEGHMDAADMRRINDSDEGWAFDYGGDRQWTRYEGVRMSEGEMAAALRLAEEWSK